ncbi:class I SAM-dependent methyltransferase [Pseudomonas fulva]|uniref:class I SAM-dependent methyltransferase n=1 Tax=Pseudomonas fulva TaxID=47880 RepID=UPI002E373028|nr:class I SAM-dependent methyltransferase [Pseudomonas fulva]
MSHHPSADYIIDLYDRHAFTWHQKRANHFTDRKWIARFGTMLRPSARVLDLGCGSGQPVARHLIGIGACVVGVDSSKQMLPLCSAQFPEQQWIHADMRTLALGCQFDAIIAWNSFFHLKPADQRRMSPISVVMRPQGRCSCSQVGLPMAKPWVHSRARRCITPA